MTEVSRGAGSSLLGGALNKLVNRRSLFAKVTCLLVLVHPEEIAALVVLVAAVVVVVVVVVVDVGHWQSWLWL